MSTSSWALASSENPAFANTKGQSYPTVIKPWMLFLPYAIVPIILAVVIANLIGDWNLQRILPQSAEQVFVLGIIFENPHIIASNIMLLDKEYLRFYRRPLILRLGLVAIVCIALAVTLGIRAFFTFFYAWTIYHVARQQIGIGKMLNRQPSRLYEAWSWLFLASSLLIAFGVGYFRADDVPISPDLIRTVICLATAATVVIGLMSMARLKRSQGRLFILANLLLLVGATVCYLQGMPLLAILLPRIVHDTSAFIIYINHDTNRNQPHAKHFLYRATSSYLPIWATLITVALLWGGVVTYSGHNWVIWLVIGLTLAHYCTEAFTWKHGSLHRRYVRMAD